MLQEYEIVDCTRRCASTGRLLEPGEAIYSSLQLEGGAVVRRDYSRDAWPGPPETAVAWWQSRLAGGEAAKAKLAPQDVLLDLFAALADEPAEAEFRYVLGLFLVRRRWLKLEEMRRDAAGEALLLDCPRREERFELRVASPDAHRIGELEQRLRTLVYGGT